MKTLCGIVVLMGMLLLAGCGGDSDNDNDTTADQPTHPNILFVVIDDVGVDLFSAFGYGGETNIDPPADVASINAIADGGVRFRNTWSMPTCSTSRASIFSGLYPFRTGVMNAITSSDLANSQLSPYTLTTPELLHSAGYVSALIGKVHIAGSDLNEDTNPLGLGAMHALGWDYFAGYQDGAPFPIDTTAGGVAPEGTYQCGFIPNTKVDGTHGADTGICYLPDGGHVSLSATEASPSPGRTCVEMGGILDPSGQPYSETRRDELDFDIANGYYVSEWVINNGDDSQLIKTSDPAARGYRSTLETDRAVDWINSTRQQQPGKPWMLSIGYSAIHTPLQPPPAALLPHPLDPDNKLTYLDLLGCGTPLIDDLSELGGPADTENLAALAGYAQSRAVSQHMLEAMDHELGRLLEQTGIASRDDNGVLHYNPDSNTVVVIVGDNGTYAPSVKLPFDYSRAKGTPYQTGVWVPLIVAGPDAVVASPNRDVESMVNVTDLYSLFAELAGLNAASVAQQRGVPLDAEPVLPYLQQPGHASIRDDNFTEVGLNITAETPPPCVVPSLNVCVEIFPQQDVCEDQGGVWYGPGAPQSFDSCCAVRDYLIENPAEYAGDDPANLQPFPESQRAMRNDIYKLVSINRMDCDSGQMETFDEFYEINESKDVDQLKLDREEDNLLAGKTPDQLTSEQEQNYNDLKQRMTALLDTQVDCPGDGNGDLIVNQTDLDEWQKWATENGEHSGLSSWYDFNHDGLTDNADKIIIEQNMNVDCRL